MKNYLIKAPVLIFFYNSLDKIKNIIKNIIKNLINSKKVLVNYTLESMFQKFFR